MAARPLSGQPDVIAQAHARSLQVGLRASETPDFHPLREPALRNLVERNHSLYTHALPVMETLHAQIVDTQSMVLLTDDHGVILHSLGDSDFVEKANRVALCPGVSWAEADRGTNAIGTALIERQPTVVHADEHFLHANRILTCSCAPIADPYGRIIGALDVSGDTRGFHKHTLALVRMSAQMIENHLFSNQFADAVRIHFHARAELWLKGSRRLRLMGRFCRRTAARCSSWGGHSRSCSGNRSTSCSAWRFPLCCSRRFALRANARR
jgi:transcriptional regulator of acetoin/glycerol metabolism